MKTHILIKGNSDYTIVPINLLALSQENNEYFYQLCISHSYRVSIPQLEYDRLAEILGKLCVQ